MDKPGFPLIPLSEPPSKNYSCSRCDYKGWQYDFCFRISDEHGESGMLCPDCRWRIVTEEKQKALLRTGVDLMDERFMCYDDKQTMELLLGALRIAWKDVERLQGES